MSLRYFAVALGAAVVPAGLAAQAAPAPPAGSFAAMPAKMVHSAWAGPEGVTFQLHSVGPWSITYVKPADDPRAARPAGSQ